MKYRDLDIFDDCTIPIPDRDEVCHQCVRWLQEAEDQYNILVLSARIKAIPNPWLREYTASIMHRTIEEMCLDVMSEYYISPMAMEQIEDDLRRITKQARNEQIWDEFGDIRQVMRDNQSVSAARVEELDKKIDQVRDEMKEEIEKLREELHNHSTKSDMEECIWPCYTANATKEDRLTFENYLKNLCCNPKTSATDVKSYIRSKANIKIIERLKPMSREYEILKKLGVSFSEKTYQNA